MASPAPPPSTATVALRAGRADEQCHGGGDGEQYGADDAGVGDGVLPARPALHLQPRSHRRRLPGLLPQVCPLQARRGPPPRQGLLQARRGAPQPQGSGVGETGSGGCEAGRAGSAPPSGALVPSPSVQFRREEDEGAAPTMILMGGGAGEAGIEAPSTLAHGLSFRQNFWLARSEELATWSRCARRRWWGGHWCGHSGRMRSPPWLRPRPSSSRWMSNARRTCARWTSRPSRATQAPPPTTSSWPRSRTSSSPTSMSASSGTRR